MANKKIRIALIVVLVCLVLFGIGKIIKDLFSDGYAYYGDGWQKTPEEAITKGYEDSELRPKNIIDVIYKDEQAIVVYIAENDSFVKATCVTNDDKEWHLQGSTEEADLSKPINFVLTGQETQQLPFAFFVNGSDIGIYGFKYTDTKPLLVNGHEVKTKTYTFNIADNAWSIDLWWYDDVDTVKEAVALTYKDEKGVI